MSERTPEYGTAPDFEPLLKKLNEQGIKAVTKQVSATLQRGPFVAIDISLGTTRRELFVSSDTFSAAMTMDFTDVRAIPGYDAIWLINGRVIECMLDSGRFGVVTSPAMMSALLKTTADTSDSESGLILTLETSLPDVSVALVSHSPLTSMLLGRPTVRPSLRIVGGLYRDVEAAQQALERLGNAILFRLDLSVGLNFQLRRSDDRLDRPRVGRRHREVMSSAPLAQHYQPQPMRLYWYARSADRMPLLRFLAFYQVLEFYFPFYIDREAQLSVRQQFKDPRFDPERDDHLARIVRTVRANTQGGFRGSESHQMDATVRGCVQDEALRDWLRVHPEETAFWAGKEGRRLSNCVINPQNKSMDLRTQVANRMYDIRCRIVHSKSDDDDRAPLLPFTEEAGQLGPDIGLIEFIAQSALIANSSKLEA